MRLVDAEIVSQFRVAQISAVEGVEAREPQEGGQPSQVNVEHEPRLAQRLWSDLRLRCDVE